MKHLLILLVRGYRFFISPYFPTSCRYYPTCSHYAIDALKIHGAFKGTALAVWRILRCNPWSAGGEDPVPGTETNHDNAGTGRSVAATAGTRPTATATAGTGRSVTAEAGTKPTETATTGPARPVTSHSTTDI